MVPDGAAGGGTQRAVVMSEVTGGAADDRAFDAAFGIGRPGYPGKRKRQDRAAQNRFH
jgi:hypothetical protein